MTDPAELDEVVVTGQRRAPGSNGPYGGGVTGGGAPGDAGGIHQDQVGENPEQPPLPVDPCADPETAYDWNADAAAADTVKDIKVYASDTHPGEDGINEREYGAVLWALPDGSMVHGPITFGADTFLNPGPDGVPGVVLDYTSPAPGAILVGTVHSHGPGGYVMSGGNYNDRDQAVLSHSQSYREWQGQPRDDARLYIAADPPAEYENRGPTKINVYEERNRDAAIAGVEGPEVNPEAMPCPAQ